MKPPARLLMLAAVIAALTVPALASAAPDMAPGGQFSFLAAGEGLDEVGSFGIAPAPTGGDVWVAGTVIRTVPIGGGDSEFRRFPLIRRFSSTGALEQTYEYSQENKAVADLEISDDGETLYAVSWNAAQSLGIERISTATGSVLGTFATPGDSGAGQLDYVTGSGIAPDGDIYARGLKGSTPAVKRYSGGGTYEADVSLGESTDGAGTSAPAVDPRNGDLLVGDGDGHGAHIDRYSSAGTFLDRFGTAAQLGSQPNFLAVRPQDGAVYAGNASAAKLTLYAANGGFVKSLPTTRELQALSAQADGARVWLVEYGASVRWFATSSNASPDPTPDPDPTDSDPDPTPTPTPTPGGGTSGTGGGTGAPAAPAPPADTTGPAIVLPAKNKTLTASKSGVISFRIGPVTEDTTGVLTLRTSKKVTISRKALLKLGTKSFQARKGETVGVRVKLIGKARRVLKRAKRLKVRAQISLRDAAGNLSLKTYTFTLKAPKRKRG